MEMLHSPESTNYEPKYVSDKREIPIDMNIASDIPQTKMTCAIKPRNLYKAEYFFIFVRIGRVPTDTSRFKENHDNSLFRGNS